MVKARSAWFRLTNKERRRYCVEAEVAKAREEAERRRQGPRREEAFTLEELMRMMAMQPLPGQRSG
jgi:hypothetical protein